VVAPDAEAVGRDRCKRAALVRPGTKYNYSNTNWFLLGLVIEKLTHDTIQNEIHRRILAPMSLSHTSFPTTNWGMPIRTPTGTRAMERAVDRRVGSSRAFVSWAAGAMISDLGDMKRWVKAYVTGTTNSAASQRARLTCLPTGEGNLSFGLGIGCSAAGTAIPRNHRLQHGSILHAGCRCDHHRLRQ